VSKHYKVQYDKDEDGMWVAVIDRQQRVSCVAQGRSIGEARRRVRDALSLYLDDEKAAAAATFEDHINGPERMKRAVADYFRAKDEAERAQSLFKQKAVKASKVLLGAGFSRRDAAEVLGVSHQHVQQLAAGGDKLTGLGARAPSAARPGEKLVRAGAKLGSAGAR
jgi:predicted RNase H-like HicB family nuclease